MSRDELREALSRVLIYEGYDCEGGMHASWRCFDKERYPGPCSCLYDTVTELLKVIDAGGES